MSEISREQVAHLAELARIDMTEPELDQLSKELDIILRSVADVSEVVNDDIKPTSHPLALNNVFRDDVARNLLTQQQGLAMAPDTEEGQFKVPAILDGE